MRRFILPFAALALLCAPLAGLAQSIDFSFTSSTQTGSPGSTATFNATITNLLASDVYLNSDSYTFSFPGLSLNDSKFFSNFPATLTAHQSVTADIFDVVIGPAVAPGTYDGTFQIIGGSDANANLNLASQAFHVQVSGTPTPPPLIAGGVAGLMLLVGTGRGRLLSRRGKTRPCKA